MLEKVKSWAETNLNPIFTAGSTDREEVLMKTNQPKRSYYPALDGLRGLAILLVVFYHNFGFINYFFFGWLGVDLFFVLSGFLITDILLKTWSEKNFLTRFYIRRVLRIFPLYYLSLFIFLILFPAFHFFPASLDYYVNNQLWLWMFLQNWLYIFKQPTNTNFLNHFWSLAVEEQFYIIWPLTILLLRKINYLLSFIIGMLVLTIALRCVLWIYHIEDLAYFNLYTFSRIDGICIGCMVALIKKKNSNFINKYQAAIVFLFAGLNFIFYFINRFYHFTFPYLALVGYSTFAMLFGLLVHDAAKKGNKVINRIFSWKLLRFFGKISYSFYIFHWPVYVISYSCIVSISKGFLPQTGYFNITQIFSSIVCTLIGILVSVLSYYSFESYFLKFKKAYH